MRFRERIRKLLLTVLFHRNLIRAFADSELRVIRDDIRRGMPDNPALNGFKVYSQSDEDGIIEEIFRRIGGGQTFIEIGCGDGLENNTHYLVLKGWTGIWIDANKNDIERIRRNIPTVQDRLRVRDTFMDIESASLLAEPVDFLSVDIDGNDYDVLKAFTARAKPKVICVEYNAKFRPPLDIRIAYNPKHVPTNDDYQGASLQAFVNLLRDYRLVACSLSGVNAFFVREDLAKTFALYAPKDVYQPLRYYLFNPDGAREPSYGFLRDKLAAHAAENGVESTMYTNAVVH